LPRPLARRLLPVLRYFNLMRALELRLMAPWVRDAAGWRVLDVGCGPGPYTLDLARRGATLIGCDLLPEPLSVARRTTRDLGLDGQAHFAEANASALPVSAEQFDLVVCNCVLEHVDDDGAALAGMARALRPGGILCLTVDNAEGELAFTLLDRLSPSAKERLLWPQVSAAPTVLHGLRALLDERYSVLRRYLHDELIRSLEELGLTILESSPYLTGIGAAHHEAFHALRILDPSRKIGRLFYMISSLLFYPLAAWSDSRRGAQGHGLAIVARKKVGSSP
jgi:ubiquinone/menaquinone biosynthesis C-methylase UbiE